MDKQALIERLLALPGDIEAAEKQVLATSQAVDAAREQVAVIEKDAILNGAITGKNETERKAQMAALTAASMGPRPFGHGYLSAASRPA